ncbi:MAG: TIGR02996 domain-containing protein [Kofleriaceae bacterium]
MPFGELLRAVLAQPEDDTARLVYADALQRAGDPYGEFIALQLGKHDTKALLDKHRDVWTAQLGAGVSDVHWVRGFAEAARIRVTGDVSALFDRAPIRDLGFTDDPDEEEPDLTDHAAKLAADPRLANLRLLATNVRWGEPIATLLASRHLGKLTALHIGDADCHAYTADAIAAAHLPSLEHLAFAGDWIGDLGDDGVARLARAELPSLQHLALLNLGIGQLGASVISRTGWKLLSLDLGWGSYTPNQIGAGGCAALAQMPTLHRLVLDHNRVGDAGVAALATTQLRSLSLQGNALTDAAMVSLASATCPLDLLELSFNKGITANGIAAFVGSPCFAKLGSLWLRQIPFGPDGAIALASSANQLRSLNLLECKIGDAGARALLESPHLERIEDLQLNGNGLSEEVRTALSARFGDRVRASR